MSFPLSFLFPSLKENPQTTQRTRVRTCYTYIFRDKIKFTPLLLYSLSPRFLSFSPSYLSRPFSLRLDRSENDGRLAPRVKGKASGRLHGGGRSTRRAERRGAVHGSKRLSPPYVTRSPSLSLSLSRSCFHLSLSLSLDVGRPLLPHGSVDALCGVQIEDRRFFLYFSQ